MPFVQVKVTRIIVQEFFPTYVECEFTDASGRTHRFRDKIAIFADKAEIFPEELPYDGTIACTILCSTGTETTIDTCEIDGVDSTTGKTRFTVQSELVGGL